MILFAITAEEFWIGTGVFALAVTLGLLGLVMVDLVCLSKRCEALIDSLRESTELQSELSYEATAHEHEMK